ncbi:MAG: hypothetical protein PHG66_06145, partial [Candidatus Colwellbacteria bacterium]|nr:hypothetical protein [Candidatus Colwellbacteria bacterium]
KTELLKCIREQTKDVDEEDEDALKESFSEVEKKFGYMAIYNMGTLAPKMYAKFQTAIDSLIEDGREDNEDAIKESEAEAEEEEKEKEKKEKEKKEAKTKKEKDSKKKSKKSDDEEEEEETKKDSKKKSDDEEEEEETDKKTEKSGSDKKKTEKSGSDKKKTEKSGSDKKKTEKSGSDKKKTEEVESGYEDGSSLAAASPRVKDSKKSKKSKTPEEEEVVEEEVVEEEEEDVKIIAKKFKAGEFKGQVYFIDGKTNTTFLLNTKERTVSHKIVDDKKVVLESKDLNIIKKYDLTQAKVVDSK